MEWIIIILFGWLVCGILGYGITFGDMQGSFPTIAEDGYRRHFTFAVFIGLLGPAGLIVSFFMSSFVEHGLKWK